MLKKKKKGKLSTNTCTAWIQTGTKTFDMIYWSEACESLQSAVLWFWSLRSEVTIRALPSSVNVDFLWWDDETMNSPWTKYGRKWWYTNVSRWVMGQLFHLCGAAVCHVVSLVSALTCERMQQWPRKSNKGVGDWFPIDCTESLESVNQTVTDTKEEVQCFVTVRIAQLKLFKPFWHRGIVTN